MSDCNTQAMMPKELRMCKTCGHENVCKYKTSLLVNCNNWIDSSERYERLAQVAWEMFHEYRELMKDYLWDNGASSSATKQRRLIVMFHDRLEECGVSVDD